MEIYSYKFRLNPTEEQKVLLAKHFGCVRFLYNHFLNERIEAYKKGESLNYYDNQKAIPNLKQENEWLKEVNSQSLQFSVRNLQSAYENFFRKCKTKIKGKKGFPRFKYKLDKQSFRVPQNVRLDENQLIIPKFREGIKIVLHRQVEGVIKFATVSKNKVGQYFVSITVERELPKEKKTSNSVGLDLNVDAVVDNKGKVYPNVFPRVKYKTNLKKLYKQRARTKKGSKGREKVQLKINRVEQTIRNIREDYQHKLSRRIINENQVIVVESLAVKNMLKNNGKVERWREKAYHRKYAEVAFASFLEKLKYKAKWYGREIVEIDQWFPSSQLCSKCGLQNKSLTLADREWACECGVVHDRDVNAAVNIYQQGQKTLGTRGLADCPDVIPSDRLLVGSEARMSLALE